MKLIFSFTFLLVSFLSLISAQWIRNLVPLPTDTNNNPTNFGCSLSFSDNGQVLAIGALTSATAMIVYVYQSSSSLWNTAPFQSLTDPTAVGNICFLTLSGDGKTLFSSGTAYNGNHGGAWIWVVDPITGNWQFQTKLDGGAGDTFFGQSGALSGDGNVIAVSASFTTLVHTYKRVSGTWSFFSDVTPGTYAGGGVNEVAFSFDGSLLMIGNQLENTNVGASWVYTQTTTGWTQLQTLVGNSGTDSTVGTWHQGLSVGITGNAVNSFLVVGSDPITGQGVWIFDTQYNQILRLKGGSKGAIDNNGNILVTLAPTLPGRLYVYGFNVPFNIKFSANLTSPQADVICLSVSNTNLIAIGQTSSTVSVWTFQVCNAGQYFHGDSNACSDCAAGYYSSAGETSCTACVAGKFSTTVAATTVSTCQACIAGTYSNTSGASSAATCQGCVAGTYSTATGATSASTCQACVAGKFSTTVAATTVSTCQACSAGTYSNTSGASSAANCQGCVAGTYSTATGATSASTCQGCSAGKFSTAVGASSATTCQGCIPGKFSAVVGASSASTCQTCAAGRFSTMEGSTCQACSAGTYSTTLGASSALTCQDCGLGTTSDPGAAVCHDRRPTFQNFSKMRFSTLQGSTVEVIFHLQNATITNFTFSNPLAYAFAPALSSTSVRIVDATGTITLMITPPLLVPIYVYANRWPPGSYTFSSRTKIVSLTGGATLSTDNLTLSVPLGNNLAFSGILEFRANLSFVQWTGTAIHSPTSILFVAAVTG